MKHLKAIIASIALFAMFAGTSLQAKVEIQWWHAFGGRLGELLDEQVNKFNASQNKYTVVHTRKGNYSETLNAGIAAFRAGQHPNILMVFEVGTAIKLAVPTSNTISILGCCPALNAAIPALRVSE